MLLGSNPDRVIQKVSTSPEGCQIILMVPDRGSASASYNPYPNMLLRPLVYQGERFALMTQRWRTLQRVAISPSTIGDIAKAILALVRFEKGAL